MTIKKILGVSALVLTLAAGLYLKTPSGKKIDTGIIQEAAAAYDARIIRDEWGVAHIFGKTDADASFGLGYSHAEDDWKVIQETIMSARGVTAQYKGKNSAPTDYLYDLFRVKETVTDKAEKELSPATLAVAKAYADGVNLWVSENPDKALPGIMPISAKDIVSGFTWSTPFFYRMDEVILPLFEAEDKPTVSPWASEASLNLPEAVRGSNAFAVAPSRSADGHTRLIVNSHQPFTGPYAWFEAHMVSEDGLNIAGAGFPGTPVLTQGITPHHGWVQTVNKPDLVDIYALEVNKPKKPTQYKLDGEWVDFEKGQAKFRVKLFGPFSLPITRETLWSKHGPVLDTPSGFYAVRFSGLGEVKALEQWYKMGKAKSFEAWNDAIAMNGILSFNITYADKDGNIAEYYNAKMPNRIEGPDWKQILPGDQSDLIWEGYHPQSVLPRLINPPSGWLFSANSTPFKITDPEFDNKREDFSKTFGLEPRMTNRAMRALELFVPDKSITKEELKAYRADDTYAENSPIRRLLDPFLDGETPDDLAEEVALLKSWDSRTNIENRATALAVMTAMHAKGYEIIEDRMSAEDALRKASAQLKKSHGRIDPTWGEVNRLVRGDTNLPLDGGPDILRAIYGYIDEYDKNGMLVAVAGDTHIMFADWAPDGSLEVESVHQFGAATQDESSPHYDDQAKLFAKDEYKPMPMTLEAVLPKATRDYRPGQ